MITVYQTRKEMFGDLLPKQAVGAELGVQFGINAKDLIRITNPTKLYLCDAWEVQDGSYEAAQKIVVKYGPNIEMIKAWDQDWIPTLEDRSLDWVYVDTLHNYPHTKLELSLLKEKVKVDGIIAGHDFICFANHMCPHANSWEGGVMLAVLETVSEGWLEIVALTRGAGNSDAPAQYPSWACRVKSVTVP